MESLTDRLGLGGHELVSFVGAGGKTTLMVRLGHELADAGHRVVITTTTKMGADQVESPVVDPMGAVEANLERGGLVYVVHRESESKMTGPSPAEVNVMFSSTSADYVLVEADGARGRSLKAPSQFEPVIPSASTVVVVVTAIDAIGRSIATACHRPERVAAILGRPLTYHLGTRDVAQVLTSAAGGLKDIPANARIVVAVTKVGSDDIEAARDLTTQVVSDPDIDRVVVIPRS
ncbi:MAG: hypothetical protein BMS9Abin07_0833 [Acidimicrobiia bacterium]|nr:MAG: hypothetical protein BMS9Abin07_0833 [Acidimicrobiia bacterium]